MNSSNQRQSEDMPSLKHQGSDNSAILAKGALGVIPYVGNLLSEIAGAIIPNQRLDRVVKFAEILETRLTNVEESHLRSQLPNEEFVGIMEDGISQAVKSTSDARREYLASVIAKGITDSEIEYNHTQRMLNILEELSDPEVIMLRFYLIETIQGDEEFRDKNRSIMRHQSAIGAPQSEHDKYTISENIREHLTSLGLLRKEYETDRETGLLTIDTFTHAPKVKSYWITNMGRLFLKHIGLSEF